METRRENPRLALVVSPRLLGDTLACALRAEGLEVVVALDESALTGGIDIAIVSETPSPSIDVPVVIRLPAPSDDGVGAVMRRGHADEPVSLRDVRSIIATLRLGSVRDG